MPWTSWVCYSLQLCCCNLLCPQRPIWNRRDVPGKDSSNTSLEEGRHRDTTLRLHLCRYWLDASWNAWTTNCSHPSLFSFHLDTMVYPCALVQWFQTIGDEPDRDTGMWMVKPEYTTSNNRQQSWSVIHLDCILRGAHLLPIFDERFIPHNLHYSETLDAFQAFYVNKYIDHHIFEIIS